MASVVDIFCGVGGLTHGFILEGFNVVAGVDSDESCQYAYECNNPGARFLHSKIEDLDVNEVRGWYPANDVKILVGCAPCQPFSTHTSKVKNKNDEWQLVDRFADLILEVDPDIISMENVPRLKSFNNGSVFRGFISKLNKRYNIFSQKVYCPDYGVPQTRDRLVVLASKHGPIKLLDPTHTSDQYLTVANTIADLPPINAGEVHQDDLLHRASDLTEINLKRIQQSLPGGTWLDWDEDLRTDCHRKESGQSYKSVYGRMEWGSPSPTITTQAYRYGTGRFGHPQQDRALSLREMALLQTFPRDYAFVNPEIDEYYFKQLGNHIGNAVPVRLARIIAQSIRHHLESI